MSILSSKKIADDPLVSFAINGTHNFRELSFELFFIGQLGIFRLNIFSTDFLLRANVGMYSQQILGMDLARLGILKK